MAPTITAMSDRILIAPTDLDDSRHAAALIELLDHYARDIMGGGAPLAEEARRHLIERLRKRQDFCGFLAFAATRPAGLINCFEGFSTFAARPLLNVHDLAVHTDFRGRGIARLLLDAAEQAARRRGCCKLTLEVLSNNQRAINVYELAGFQPYTLDPDAGQALFMQKNL